MEYNVHVQVARISNNDETSDDGLKRPKHKD
jgi:hypothetical protein